MSPGDHRPAADGAPGLHIRYGIVEDAKDVEAVHFASREAAYRDHVTQWPPPGEPTRQERVARWRRWIEDPANDCLVGEFEGRIVGFCVIRPSGDEDRDAAAVAEMPTLYVEPSAWRAGYGRALCAAGVERARARGFAALDLWVLDVNERARLFYEAVGFRADGSTQVVEETEEKLVARRYGIRLEGTKP